MQRMIDKAALKQERRARIDRQMREHKINAREARAEQEVEELHARQHVTAAFKAFTRSK